MKSPFNKKSLSFHNFMTAVNHVCKKRTLQKGH